MCPDLPRVRIICTGTVVGPDRHDRRNTAVCSRAVLYELIVRWNGVVVCPNLPRVRIICAGAVVGPDGGWRCITTPCRSTGIARVAGATAATATITRTSATTATITRTSASTATVATIAAGTLRECSKTTERNILIVQHKTARKREGHKDEHYGSCVSKRHFVFQFPEHLLRRCAGKRIRRGAYKYAPRRPRESWRYGLFTLS